MIDGGRVVEVLPASWQIQAVQSDLRLGGLERNLHLVPGEHSAEGDRVRREPACASLANVHERDMERRLGLVLDLVMFDDGALVEDDLGERIVEVDAAFDACMGLHDRRPAAGACEHHRQRMRHQRGGARIRDEHQVDRFFHGRVGRDPNESAVLTQGYIERGESLGALAEQALLEQRFERLAFLGEHRGEAAELDAFRQVLQRRKLVDEITVDEDHPRAAEIAREFGDVSQGQRTARGRFGRLERDAQDRRDPGVLPGLVLGSREAMLAYPLESRAAQRLQPTRKVPVGFGFKA